MKVLITGICGFVGSVLAARWSELNPHCHILGIDNLSRRGSWRNLDSLRSMGIPVFHGDIRSTSDVELCGPVDAIVDAAAHPSVLGGLGPDGSSRQLVENNLLGTVNLLEYCRKHRAAFVLLSTSRVYSIAPLASLPVEVRDGAYRPIGLDSPKGWNGPTGLSPLGISEAFSTASPISLYGSTKLASEQLALEYGYAFGFPVWINRCGVLAGAGQFGRADQGIFSYWLHSWREGKPLRYLGFDGQGTQVRDCLHPQDLVPLLAKQVATKNDDRSPIINVSGGIASSRSLRQLSDFCRDRWGERAVASDPSPRKYDLPWVVLDSSLAQRSWNWIPTLSAEEILDGIAVFAEQNQDWIDVAN
jgi:CDP-paratose 2-epimerase